jgi:ABC-type transporter Mla subunit MlaD
MTLKLIIDKLEEAPENVRPLYVEAEGKYKLDVDGVIPKSDFDSVKKELDSLQGLVKGPEGKTFKEMFEGSQTANKAIRKERETIESQLRQWQELGELDSIRQWKDELDGLKATGAKLTDAQQQIADLKKANRQYLDEAGAVKKRAAELEEMNKGLAEFRAKTEKQLDLSNAEAQIAEIVESIQGANQKALRRNLIDRYKAGDLKRDETGKLIAAEENMSLAAYAQSTMEAYGLFNQSNPGISSPPSSTSKANAPKETTFSSLAGMLK